MKILITGGNGYIGKSLYNNFKDEFDITLLTREEFDLCNYSSMLKFFNEKYFDVVLNCAAVGVNDVHSNDWKIMIDNIKIYDNLFRCRNYFKKLINFGSGCELYNEDTPYSISKRIIQRCSLSVSNFFISLDRVSTSLMKSI